MPEEQRSVEDIFSEAVRLEPGPERAAYLDKTCGDDQALKERVERLLRAADDAGSFLDSPAMDCPPTVPSPVTECPGDMIGPYKLLQQVGEGGMGVVFMAEQTKPIDRRVALKIIKPGMDSKHVIARFEAERQALAMMDHPNISKVYDAGTTATGRPYFVMELVKGVPITEYCDEHHLTPKERLELFLPVCHAVQHAHQKGVIHRDLKPSNVLVADYDDQAVPKIIDFGVAKAIEHRLTEKTMFTEFGQVLGTVEYMSPEQAKLNQWDIDTRSDIYSLGVLLYELLTGETPFDRARFRKEAFDEILRVIREEDPPRPSLRLSGSQSLPSIAANRKIEPKKLSALMRGELDWVVMKALEKDRARRYETAGKFAEDLQHYINDEAVEACPPSAAYKFRKFARRNRPVLATLSAVAASLLIGAGVATWQAVRATEQRDRALAAEAAAAEDAAIAKAVNDFLNDDLLLQANPWYGKDPDITLREVVDRAAANVEERFAGQPLVEAAIQQTVADAYKGLGEYEISEWHNQKALAIRRRELGEEDIATLESMLELSGCYHRLGRPEDARKWARKIVEIAEPALGEAKDIVVQAENLIGHSFKYQVRDTEAETHYRRALELDEKLHGKKTNIVYRTNLAIAVSDPVEKERLFREALEIGTSKFGADDFRLASTKYWLAVTLGSESAEAIDLLREALAARERVFGPEHPLTQDTRYRLAFFEGERHQQAGDYEDAIKQYSEAIRWKPTFGTHADTYFYRGIAYAARGEWEKAIADYGSVIREDPNWLAGAARERGSAYAALGDWAKAAEDFSTAVEKKPEDLSAWLRLMPVLVLSGDEAAYKRYCAQGLELARDTDDGTVADIVCKLVLLRPNVVDMNDLPVEALDKALQEGTASPEMEPWHWATRALVAYRRGDAESAAKFVAESMALDTTDLQQALDLSLLAMARQRLERPDEARQALRKATELIDQLENKPETRGHFDLLIAMIMRNEADALINGEEETGSAVSANDADAIDS